MVQRVETLMTTCRAIEAEIELARRHVAHRPQEAFVAASS